MQNSCSKTFIFYFCRSVDDIDLFTGGVSEKPLPGARVGPLFACIIGLQFKALKYGDRFYYENDERNVKFTTEQLNEIRNTLMANVICRNTDISKIHRNVFEKKTARYVDLPKLINFSIFIYLNVQLARVLA